MLAGLAWLVVNSAAETTAQQTNSSHVAQQATPMACTLQSLAMRFRGQPIDLEPPFQKFITEYIAYLDFAMEDCSVQARPDTGCEVAGVPPTPVTVQIGGEQKITLYAVNAETQEKKAYVVTVKRLLGSETDLQVLRVENSAMSPVFDPDVRSYSVRLGLGVDEARIVYRLRDNSQRIRSSATQETPQGDTGGLELTPAPPAPPPGSNGTNASHSGDDHSSSRRLDQQWDNLPVPFRRLTREVESGEVQVKEAYVNFMVDVGFARQVTLTVQCADATQADIGTYKLELSRPSCTPERPFFDPDKQFCTSFCPSGYYKSREMNRCARCNTNCKVCDSLLVCSMCHSDTQDFKYVVQPDGSCHAYPNQIFKKYRVWCIGLAVLLLFLVLIGCAGICNLCCGGGGGNGKYKKFRTYSDSEEEELTTSYAARRPMGKY